MESVTSFVTRRPVRASTLYTAVFALLGWFRGLAPLSDNSFFWHLRTGELILDRGFPHTDPYSFAAGDGPWVVQSWLAEVVDASLDRLAGGFGIRLLNGLLCAIVCAWLYRLALQRAKRAARAAFVTVPAAFAVAIGWSPRPLGLGLLALVALVTVLEAPAGRLGRQPLVVLPVLFWLWANVHGTFVLGFAYVGLHLVGRWLDGAPPWRDRERSLLLGTGAGFLATFVSPYGWRLVVFPLTPLGRRDVFARIVEWRSPELGSQAGLALALLLVVAVGCLALGPRRPSRRDLVVLLPFVVLALGAQRNVALLAIVSVPVAARAIAPAEYRPPTRLVGAGAALATFVAAALVFAVVTAGTPDFAFGRYPVRAYRAYEDAGLEGSRLATTDVWAGWVILEHWPAQEVFVDDRYDLFPPEVARDYLTLLDGDPGWEQVLDEYRIDAVLWPVGRDLSPLLADSDEWKRVYRDDRAVLYVRQ